MKQKIIYVFLLVILIQRTGNCQIVDKDSAKTKSFDEATTLLIKEVNYYRQIKKLDTCQITPRLSSHAYRWCRYMMNKHVSDYNKFYKHSTFAPKDSTDLVLPGDMAEIIHLVYFTHKPSVVEAVAALMYGVNRGEKSILGWTISPEHNKILLTSNFKYMGVSVFVSKRDIYWLIYGIVNFSQNK